jgi:hypothetical protein
MPQVEFSAILGGWVFRDRLEMPWIAYRAPWGKWLVDEIRFDWRNPEILLHNAEAMA